MITYEEVEEWWDNSEWHMSTYPPSSWLAYAEQEGLDIEELAADAAKHEAGVAELHAATDNTND
jgi:hypothetical protein